MFSQETPPILNGGLTPNEKPHTIFGGNADTKGGYLRGRRTQESMS